MVLQTFVPGRNSRHRTAALALFRHLIRQGRRVPFPSSVGWVSTAEHPGKHPLPLLVRRQFDKNTAFVSFRLIYAAMKAGYQFLTIFCKAQTADNAEYERIAAHVRTEWEKSVPHSVADNSRQPVSAEPFGTAIRPSFLTNISKSGEWPYYERTVESRPVGTYKALARPIPRFASTAEGYPFLRFGKPQSQILSQKILVQNRRFVQEGENITFCEDLDHEAALEDIWEASVREQMRREGVRDPEEDSFSPENSFKYWTGASKLWSHMQREATWGDWIARGEALQRIVDEEKARAAEESGGARQAPAFERPPPRPDSKAVVPVTRVGKHYFMASLAMARDKEHAEDPADPFSFPAWREFVHSQRDVLRKWAKDLPNNQQ